MVKVIIVNGKPGCGKTTFEQLCENKRENVTIVSSIDFVKRVAIFCGWNGEKTPEDRKFLSELKQLLSEWRDVPFQKIKEYVVNATTLTNWYKKDYYIFVDSREPKEIDRFKKEMNAFTILIRRPGDEDTLESNKSDEKVFDYNYDLTISNDSDIMSLSKLADGVLDYIDNYFKEN